MDNTRHVSKRRVVKSAENLFKKISHVFAAHTFYANTPKDRVRFFDGLTPYAIHPIWCAMTILQEPLLCESLRYLGAEVLLYHDIIEDTDAGLPKGTSRSIRLHVKGMTFKNSEDEWENVWSRGQEVLLFKLYDKVGNWQDSSWMTPERKSKHRAHLIRLTNEVEQIYGRLNIVLMARALDAEVWESPL